jgi:DNA invertase Pin-like site-specific DNA recombinase
MHLEEQSAATRGLERNRYGERAQIRVLGYASVRSPSRIDDTDFTRQEAMIEWFCARRQWAVAGLLRDVQPRSSRSWGRPSLTGAMERLRRGEADCLMTAELDRLCPSVAEVGSVLEALEDMKVRFISLNPPLDTGQPLGRGTAHVIMAVSEWERNRRADITSAARAKGSGARTISPALKRRIVRMREAGMTLQAIADDLNDEDVPTVRGGATWRPSSVQAALGYRRPAPWPSASSAGGTRRSRVPEEGEGE